MRTRNIYGGLVMTAAALLCLAGCKKDEEGEKIMLGTQFEKAVSAQKTYLGENNYVCWSTGDSVFVNGVKYKGISSDGIAVTEDEHYYAVYPAVDGNSVGESGGTVEIPASQIYHTENGKQVIDGPMAAHLDASSGILYFKNLYSLLKVTVSADDKDFTVSSITVTATGETPKALAGTYGFSFGEQSTTEAAPTVNPYANKEKDSSTTVTLTCGSDNTVSANEDKDFYLVVHPLTTAQKLTVKVNGVLDGKRVVYTYNTLSERTLNRSRIGGLAVNLQQLEPVLRGIGEFTVNAKGKQVEFSPGNLQYQASGNGTWRFAEHQYDYIGKAAGNTTASDRDKQSDWIDLFGWGTSGYYSKYPYMTSQTNADYGSGESDIAGTNYDWGVYNEIQSFDGNTIYPKGTWRTPTKDEWDYLIKTRAGASNLRKTGVTVCGKSNCLIIAPDGFTGTIETSYNESAWSAAEAAGLVCLPAAGYRIETSVYTAGSWINYWSSTHSGDGNAYYLEFYNGGILQPCSSHRLRGRSVRLVKDVE